MKFGLKESTINSINQVLLRYQQVERVLLYGSRAKGKYRVGSDIDLTLVGKNLEWSLVAKIEGDLDELLLPYKIDLSIYTQIENTALIDHINRIGVVFYEK